MVRNRYRTPKTGPGAVGLGMLAAATLAGPSLAQPVARCDFSVDLASPFPPFGAASMWLPSARVGPDPGPSLHFDGSGVGLLEADDIDGWSKNQPLTGTAFYLAFSVDRNAIGATPPMLGVPPLGFNYPFAVVDQVALGQAAGDVFISSEMYVSSGRVGGLGLYSNALLLNQAQMSGQNLNLEPALDPSEPADPLLPIVNVDAITDVCNGRAGGIQGFVGPEPEASLEKYFSLTATSPSVARYGPPSGACVYQLTDDPMMPVVLYTVPPQVGLLDADDIDGLVVYDDSEPGFGRGTWSRRDAMMFSLAPGSPSLAMLGAEPGDVFVRRFEDGVGPLTLAHRIITRAELGLAPLDNVDALDIIPDACGSFDLMCVSRRLASLAVIDWLNLEVEPLTAGRIGTFTVHNARPNEWVYLYYTAGKVLSPTYLSSLDVTLSIEAPVFALRSKSDLAGRRVWRLSIPLNAAGRLVWFQAAQKAQPGNLVPVVVQAP